MSSLLTRSLARFARSFARSAWTVTNTDTRADIGANIDHFDATGGLKGNQEAQKSDAKSIQMRSRRDMNDKKLRVALVGPKMVPENLTGFSSGLLWEPRVACDAPDKRQK